MSTAGEVWRSSCLWTDKCRFYCEYENLRKAFILPMCYVVVFDLATLLMLSGFVI